MLFNVLSAISEEQTTKGPATSNKPHIRPLSLDHHIFDGTYGWMVKESCKQPSVNLRIFTKHSDYDHLNLPCPDVRSTKVTAVMDTGAPSSLIGFKTFPECRFSVSDIVLIKKMYAANNKVIKILGAVIARLFCFR